MLSPQDELRIKTLRQRLIFDAPEDDLDLQLISAFVKFCDQMIERDYNNRIPLLEISRDLKKKCAYILQNHRDNLELAQDAADTIWTLRRMEGRNRQLDSYLIYLEKNRQPRDMFYIPKRKQFWKIGLIQALQQMLDDELDLLTISLPPGTGKGQLLDDVLLTPDGFKKFRELKVGDEVISGTGKISSVLGIFPKPKMQVYELTFDDGSKVKCSQDHIWHVRTRDDRRRNNKYRDIELKDMLRNFRVEYGKRANYSVDYVPKIDCFTKKDLHIDPYVLGVLIGDGCISGSNNIQVSTPDQEILDLVLERLPDGYYFNYASGYDYRLTSDDRNRTGKCLNIKLQLQEYGLYGKKSYEKFIPHDYLYASYDDRLELLRGLLDTDGYADGKAAEFSTSSKQLAHDVCELVHSLGGYCSLKKKTKSGYRDQNGEFVECRDAYRLVIQFPSDFSKPFHLSRKADRFNPKRKNIKRFITDIQYVGDEETVCIYIDDPSHLYITNDYIITHNTTLSKFFISGVIGWFPRDYNLFFSHNNDITRMYYDGALDIVSDHDEYTWHEVFPNLHPNHQNAKMQQFNIGKYKPFPSLQCTSRGSNNAGVVRCSKFLMVDDLIAGIEEALNRNTLDKLWDIYRVDARQRKIDGAKEIHICTRWSTADIVGRLQDLYGEDNPRCKFIAVPDIDPESGKSNFMYDVNGFTEKFFNDQEMAMDDISYRCLYKNDPIEREGLLYHEEELRRFYSLPDIEPDAVIGVCDTKSKGIDYMVLPVMYKYGEDYYMVDCVCDDNSDFGVQKERLTRMIVDHEMQQCEFESNAGGDRLAADVAEMVAREKGRCNITTKATETNKETRIIVNSDWIKKHVLFKAPEQYQRKSDYGRFMNFMTTYSVAGKNKHDDCVDCLANFALFVTRGIHRRKTKIMRSPI